MDKISTVIKGYIVELAEYFVLNSFFFVFALTQTILLAPDSDLVTLYAMKDFRLNEITKRNLARFSNDFMN